MKRKIFGLEVRYWLLLLVLIALSVAALIWIPQYEGFRTMAPEGADGEWHRSEGITLLEYNERVDEYRRTVIQVRAGIFVIVGLLLNWMRTRALQQQAAVQEKTFDFQQSQLDSQRKQMENEFELSRKGQINERFNRAVEQLGSDRLAIRLGGIFALEQISKDDPEAYHWPVMDLLATYVRENGRGYPSPEEEWHTEMRKRDPGWQPDKERDVPGRFLIPRTRRDIRVIFEVIGRRDRGRDGPVDWEFVGGRRVNLSGAPLAYIELSAVKVGSLDLSGAVLKEADLLGAQLEGANLIGANLKKSTLFAANLEGANLIAAWLSDAKLGKTHLKGTQLGLATLNGASLVDVKDLTAAQLSEAADLKGIKAGLPLLRELKELVPEKMTWWVDLGDKEDQGHDENAEGGSP